jgi:small subunit ribosomal protein S20
LPHKRAAYKELRKGKKRHERNITTKSELKSLIKKFETLVSEKKTDEAKKFFNVVASKMAKAAGKGIIHKNTVARKISRLAKRLSSPAKA